MWIEKTPSHQALLLLLSQNMPMCQEVRIVPLDIRLRSCRAKLIQRFGGIDRAYIRLGM